MSDAKPTIDADRLWQMAKDMPHEWASLEKLWQIETTLRSLLWKNPLDTKARWVATKRADMESALQKDATSPALA